MSTALVWFRRDLRVHDHPPLARAVAAHDRVVPIFVLDHTLLARGRFPSPSRTEFLLGCLAALDAALGERGAGLVLREGPAAAALVALAIETRAEAVYWAGDVSPYARVRDRGVTAALRSPDDIALHALFAGTAAYVLTCATGHPLLVPEAALPFWAAFGAVASA